MIDDARRRRDRLGQQTVLFVDEVHRFSKTQQDALLGAVEDRLVLLVAATTENPSFSVVVAAAVAVAGAGAAAADRRRRPRRCCAGPSPTRAGWAGRSPLAAGGRGRARPAGRRATRGGR